MENEEEVFVDIAGYEGYYQISNFCRVKSFHKNGQMRKQHINAYGYYAVTLCKNGRQRTYAIHSLMAVAFLGHIPNGSTLEINHINGNRLKSTLDNIEIVTHRANTATCFRKDRAKFTSQYVGVSFDKRRGRWDSWIQVNKKSKRLGAFSSEIEASIAYQNALSKI